MQSHDEVAFEELQKHRRERATIKNVRRFVRGLTPKNMARLSKASQKRLQKAAKRLMR